MSSISLSVYEVVIYKKNGSSKNTENISDFNNGNDLLKLFQKLPELLDATNVKISVVNIKESKKRLRINSKEFKPFGRLVSGEIETGDYGTENPIVSPSGVTISTINKDHSTMSPFYFLCDLEKNSRRAILILQRFRQFGIYTLFNDLIRREFDKQNPGYTIRIDPLVSKKALDAVIKNGVIKKLTFQSVDASKIAKSINAKNDSDYFNPNDVYCEYTIVAKKNKSISLKNSISKILGADVEISDYITLREFDYNKLKINFDLNGKPQTIDVSNWRHFSPDIDITSKVTYAPSGFPKLNDIQSAAMELLNDIKTELNK